MRESSQMIDWNKLCTIGGVAALLTVLVSLVETGLTFLPAGTSADTVTVLCFHRRQVMIQ
jgi:hypothetical protein